MCVTVGKRTLGLLAVLSLAAPVAAAHAFARGESDPRPTAARATFGAAAQTLAVSAHADPAPIGRGSYSVEVIDPGVLPDTGAAVSRAEPAAAGASIPAQGYSGENVVAYAQQFVGVVPYGNGNHPSDSFSCDGYVQYVFAGFGIHLPRTANAQAALGTPIPRSEARAGDLLWWPNTHIAIYDGNGGMLDSPYWGQPVRHRADLWNDPIFIRLDL